MTTVTLARPAMATRFELVLHGPNEVGLRAAGEEALAEIDRLENRLSLYRPGSEIAQLNARAAREAVQVSPEVFGLLQHAQELSEKTGGAFDVTIAPLVRCWGFMGANGSLPVPEELAEARTKIGMQHLCFDRANRTIRFAREGVMIDLGAIGKGYAVEKAAEILREAGVISGLIHGGTSTIYAIGHPPDAEAWKVALEEPPPVLNQTSFPKLPLVELRDEALSASAIWGRIFQAAGKSFGHVIDPRTGSPVERAFLTVVILPSATETDALSTALLVLGPAGQSMIRDLRPGAKTMVVTERDGIAHVQTNGDLARAGI